MVDTSIRSYLLSNVSDFVCNHDGIQLSAPHSRNPAIISHQDL
eukprot:SAG31_NODE_35471_length_322_cov_2.197309_1_plen_42_part_10